MRTAVVALIFFAIGFFGLYGGAGLLGGQAVGLWRFLTLQDEPPSPEELLAMSNAAIAAYRQMDRTCTEEDRRAFAAAAAAYLDEVWKINTAEKSWVPGAVPTLRADGTMRPGGLRYEAGEPARVFNMFLAAVRDGIVKPADLPAGRQREFARQIVEGRRNMSPRQKEAEEFFRRSGELLGRYPTFPSELRNNMSPKQVEMWRQQEELERNMVDLWALPEIGCEPL